MRGRKGFTLVEIIVVIAVIALLMGLLFPALRNARERARIARARSQVMVLQQAWLAYWNTYNELPTYNAMTAAACDLLGGNNPDGIAFVEFDQSAYDNGLVDPWGNLYQLEFDTVRAEAAGAFYRTRVMLRTVESGY